MASRSWKRQKTDPHAPQSAKGSIIYLDSSLLRPTLDFHPHRAVVSPEDSWQHQKTLVVVMSGG